MAKEAANQKAPRAPSPASRSRSRDLQQLSLHPISLPNGQMTKLKQFINKFDVLYSREASPWIGGVQTHTSSETPFPGTLGESEFYLAVLTRKQGTTGWVVRDFLIRLAGPILQGKVNKLKLSWRVVIGVC